MPSTFKIITIDELLKLLSKYNHRELHVHHTWRPNHKNFKGNNGIELQQGMRNYHVNNLGWSDIGQHVTLLPDGTFVTGRDFGQNPASITGKNTGAFAVEMLGNFDIGNDKFEGKQKESMLRLAKYFDDRKRYVRFHRENSSKTCPGTSIDKTKFMQEVRALNKPQEIFVYGAKEEKFGPYLVEAYAKNKCNNLKQEGYKDIYYIKPDGTKVPIK